jgi:hypothetical protein
MKKLLVLLGITLILLSSSVFAQTLADLIDETRGDTLVIKDYFDAGDENNTLYNVMAWDTVDVPAGRVYELKKYGFYPIANGPVTLRPTVLYGSCNTRLVQNDVVTDGPPLICGAVWADGASNGNFVVKHDLLVQNINIIPGNSNGGLGWSFWNHQVQGGSLTLDNCYMERTRWVFVNSGSDAMDWIFKDCYFSNMIGQECRRNGGVIDLFAPQDTLLVENCTHIYAQGLVYKLRSNKFNRVIYNHNTFINMSNLVFLDLGYQEQLSMHNNIFVNCNVQPYGGKTIDPGEEDVEQMPVGLVNLYNDPEVTFAERHFMIENNCIYWDSRLADIADLANTAQINGQTVWTSQMITMNARTQAMFDDDATYPYLVEENWYQEMPNFTDPQNLMTTVVDDIKTYSLAAIDTASSVILPDWRLVNTGAENFIYSDWPIPVDLSYDNATLLTGATGGFPVGDLNWFPAEKAAWMAQKDAEYAAIDAALTSGVPAGTDDVESNVAALPAGFEMSQNYPNPFNPTTKISYTVPQASDVTLKVYDSMGREVATLVDGYKAASSYEVKFDGANLASGVYFYTLEAKDFKTTNKMMLLK